MSISICFRKDDIIGYLRVRVEEGKTPEVIDRSLEADGLLKIHKKKCRKCTFEQ